MTPPVLGRCANCQRAGVMGDGGDLLWCIVCSLSFCRGSCHADFTAGRWLPSPITQHAADKAQANDSE